MRGDLAPTVGRVLGSEPQSGKQPGRQMAHVCPISCNPEGGTAAHTCVPGTDAGFASRKTEPQGQAPLTHSSALASTPSSCRDTVRHCFLSLHLRWNSSSDGGLTTWQGCLLHSHSTKVASSPSSGITPALLCPLSHTTWPAPPFQHFRCSHPPPALCPGLSLAG